MTAQEQNDLPPYPIGNVDSLHISIYTVAHDEDHSYDKPSANATSDKAKYDSPTTVEIICAQQQYISCRTAGTQGEQRNCELGVNEKGLLVFKARNHRVVQTMLPLSFRQRVLKRSHFPTIAGHSCQRRIDDTLRQTFYWLHLAASAGSVVRNCIRRAQNSSGYRHRRNMELFTTSGPLEFIPIDNVESLENYSGQAARIHNYGSLFEINADSRHITENSRRRRECVYGSLALSIPHTNVLPDLQRNTTRKQGL